jgi:microcystin-dependent protein
MVDAVEPLKALIIPARGADVGTWDTPTNANATALGGMLGGLASIGLTNANVTLSAPAGSITPGAGPNQSQNAIIRFTGTLTGNVIITLPLPGYYVIDNRCTVGTYYVQLTNGGGGEVVGVQPGAPVHVYSDGTNVRFVNLPPVGAFLDLCGVTAVPAWIGACTTPPYLLCDGSVYNISAYTFLGNILGATFGGNGSTTFGVPDLRGRWRIALDPAGNYLTSATMSPDGKTLAATGGKQNQTLAAGNVPQVSLAGTQQTVSLNQALNNGGAIGRPAGTGGPAGSVFNQITPTVTFTPGGTVGSATPTALTTLPPVIVTGITLVRAG